VKGELGIDRVAISGKDRSRDYGAVLRDEIENGFRPMLL
jgi:hypothetical protein